MDGSKIAAGGSAGAGLGAIAVYLANRFGAHLTAEDGAIIAVSLVGVVAFVSHNGLAGAFRVIWRGGTTTPASAPAAAQPSGVAPEPPAPAA